MIVGKLQFLFTTYLGIQFLIHLPFPNTVIQATVGYLPVTILSFFSYFIQSWVFLSVATLRQLIQPDLESRFIVRSQLGPRSSQAPLSSAGLKVVTQSTYPSKDYYPQLVSNPYRSPNSVFKVAELQVHATTPGQYTMQHQCYLQDAMLFSGHLTLPTQPFAREVEDFPRSSNYSNMCLWLTQLACIA